MGGMNKKIKQEMKLHPEALWRSADVQRRSHRFLQKSLDVVFPPQPLWIKRGGGAMGALTLIDDPQCAICGFPFPYDLGAGALCGNCSANVPAFDRARAAFIYNHHSRQPILSLKHGGQTHGLPVFAQQLSRAGRSLFEGADYLVPVPLHPRRLRERRFNQAALLARALSRIKNIPMDTQSLIRVKSTESQGGKTASGRRRNMQGAFALAQGRKSAMEGRNIILIDDVLTTGATVQACARVLKRAGAARVDVLTLARVVKDETGQDDDFLSDTIM